MCGLSIILSHVYVDMPRDYRQNIGLTRQGELSSLAGINIFVAKIQNLIKIFLRRQNWLTGNGIFRLALEDVF